MRRMWAAVATLTGVATFACVVLLGLAHTAETATVRACCMVVCLMLFLASAHMWADAPERRP